MNSDTVDLHRKYGFCRGGCNKWKPRDDMRSINISVYDEDNREMRIPLRFCPECNKKIVEDLLSMAWDNILFSEAQIRCDKAKAEKSNLTVSYDTETIHAALIADERMGIYTGAPKPQRIDVVDDSEAGLRRSGKVVDVRY